MRVLDELDERLGGPAARRIVVVLALTLGLVGADSASLGAVAPQLERAFRIGNGTFGVVAGTAALAGAVATLPAGVLVDRLCRTRLLGYASISWAVATIVSALAWSLPALLISRLALGVLIAIAGPGTASLLGDCFDFKRRARMFGLVLAGELIGTGVGFVVAGELAAVSWRAAFAVLALPPIVLARLLFRLPEPARSTATAQVGDQPKEMADPSQVPLVPAVGYLLRIKTNLVLIVASACGYFFFAGIRTFAVTYARDQYGLPQSAATALIVALGVGALGGVLTGGRLADWLRERGVVAARPLVATIAVLIAALLFVPALLAPGLGTAMPLLFLAAWALGTLNPPVDAARLDILHPRLWGRGEGVRTVARAGAETLAPVLIGLLSGVLAGGGHAGLQAAFLVSVGFLVVAGALAFIGVRTYPRDVETAGSSACELAELRATGVTGGRRRGGRWVGLRARSRRPIARDNPRRVPTLRQGESQPRGGPR